MAAGTQLMDLPNEMLCEVLTHVPYEHIHWPRLRYVNRRFMRIVSDDSFERKVATTQYYNLYHLLPASYTKSNPLYGCKEWSEYFHNSMQPLSHLTGQVRDLVELGSILAGIMPKRIKRTVLDYIEQHELHMADPRVEVYFLRLLRFLPSGIEKLLRYSAFKLYQNSLPISLANCLNAEPQVNGYTPEILATIHGLLGFEYYYTHGEEMPQAPLHNGLPLNMGLSIKESRKRTILTENKGKYLPSMTMITRATVKLSYTDYEHMWTTFDELFGPWPYDAKREASQQLILTKELCEDIEAEDGKKITQILTDLDPKALKQIMVEQEQFIANLKSLNELCDCLADEVKLLMASR